LIEQNRALLRAADEDVALALAELRPILSWSSSMTKNLDKSQIRLGDHNVAARLDAELLVYDFGASKMAVQSNKEAVLATRQKLLSVEQKVLVTAVEAFMTVRRDTEKVALRRSNLDLLTEELRAVKERFEVGLVTRTDVALAEARMAASGSALAAAEGTLNIAIEEFDAAVGHRPKALDASYPVLESVNDLKIAKAAAVRHHPDMKEVQHKVTIAELYVKRAKLTQRPKIKLTGSYGLSDDIGSQTYSGSGSIKLGVTGPISLGGKLPAQLRQAMAQRDSARHGLYLIRLGIEQNVGNAFARLRVARAAKKSGVLQIRAAQVAFQGVREEASLGARTTLDVLNAEQELLDAKNAMVSALADEQIAGYNLVAAMGLMTADQLGLNVPKYDPSAYYTSQQGGKNLSQQGKKLERILKALGKK
jgi:outer membrane protein